jgi:CxxC-x17-CxxC domain-containing protein
MSQDTEIVCADCQTPFVFTASEQAFFEEKGFTPPKRCKQCRQVRKAQKESGDGGGNYRSERPRQDRRGGGGAGGQRQMYDAVCSDCGVQTQVPFKPNSDRPVYCRDCFKGPRS